MSAFARLMYRGLQWKERQRALRGAGAPAASDPGGHGRTGARGETLVYWYLRAAGYVILARNRRARSGAGELDLIGWDGPVLSFVEVKTRTSTDVGPPEAAVNHAKRRRLARAAKEYMRRLPHPPPSYRFDVASVAWDARAGLQVRLIKDAFRP